MAQEKGAGGSVVLVAKGVDPGGRRGLRSLLVLVLVLVRGARCEVRGARCEVRGAARREIGWAPVQDGPRGGAVRHRRRGVHGVCNGTGRRTGQSSRSSTISQLVSMEAVLASMAVAEQYLS